MHVTVPVEDIHVVRVSSVSEYRERLARAHRKATGEPEPLVIHASMSSLFGRATKTMREMLGLPDGGRLSDGGRLASALA